jgi:hypothetical protein
MRLSEFTDPKDYPTTNTNSGKLLRRKQPIQATIIRDDDTPNQPRPKKRPSDDRAKRSDTR